MTHYHVGTNIPGYLPEGDVYGCEEWSDAFNVWKEELDQQADTYTNEHLAYHHNENDGEGCLSGSAERCDWYELVVQVDAEKLLEASEGDEISVTFHTPEGPDIAVWLQACTETDCKMTWDED